MIPAVPWRQVPGSMEVSIRVTPRASRPALGGGVGGPGDDVWLAARVTPPPEDGRTNMALIALLARALDVAPSAYEVVAGSASRRKRVRVAGDLAALERRLAALPAARVGRDRPG